MTTRAESLALLVICSSTGGVEITFKSVKSSVDDPFWCPLDPVSGGQVLRTITMELQCNPDVPGAKEIQVIQNATNYCEYVALSLLSLRLLLYQPEPYAATYHSMLPLQSIWHCAPTLP